MDKDLKYIHDGMLYAYDSDSGITVCFDEKNQVWKESEFSYDFLVYTIKYIQQIKEIDVKKITEIDPRPCIHEIEEERCKKGFLGGLIDATRAAKGENNVIVKEIKPDEDDGPELE